jgi:hypothetical protein
MARSTLNSFALGTLAASAWVEKKPAARKPVRAKAETKITPDFLIASPLETLK